MKIVLNILAFQATWFACVLGAVNGLPWLGVAVAFAAVLLHLAVSARRITELKLVAAAGAVGFAAESLLMAGGFVRYVENIPFPDAPPVWLIALWMAFGTMLNVSLALLKTRPVLSALLGAVAGMAAYAGGARLGGMTLSEPLWTSLAAIGAMWAIALPLLLALARRWTPRDL